MLVSMPGLVASRTAEVILTRGWRRVLIALALSTAVGLLLGQGWDEGTASVLVRVVVLGLVATLVFGVFEEWPRQLPRWLARWTLQVAAVALAMPLSTFAIWTLSTKPGAPPFWESPDRLSGFMLVTMFALLVAPWTALTALVRQKEALARHQALAFELERIDLERQALDARLHVLQAQVAPHFLFNTLANVQALVDAGSPRAAAVLRSLVAYLRAAVPLLDEPEMTIGSELRLVQAYLELMHMRIPDRLAFTIDVDDSALGLRCPPATLLTLVENAVRHGIDPHEDGGAIAIEVRRHHDRCMIRVSDTGAGLRSGPDQGLGTGLPALRERLELMFGRDAHLRLEANAPHGVRAEVDMPAHERRGAR